VPAEKKTRQTSPKRKKIEDGAQSATPGPSGAAAAERKRAASAAKLPGSARRRAAAGAAPRPSAAPKPGAAPRPLSPSAARAALKSVILGALEDMKALEIKVLDVRGLTDIADFMVIASGTSDRHVRSVAQRVVEKTKQAGYRPHGVEGQQDGDWVLIDLHEMIVHIMLPRVREFYGLEKLWDMTSKRAAHG